MDELDAYDFVLPEAQIARVPPEARDGGRLLDLRGSPADRRVPDLVGLLSPDDLLVVNEVRVHKARLRARRESGGEVEVMLARPLGDGRFEALLRPARRLRVGECLQAGPGVVRLLERGEGSWIVRPEPDVERVSAAVGEVPLPPYLHRAPTAEDEQRYQTVYHRPGPHLAAAAPTAGLHLSAALLAALAGRGIRRVALSLEVGLGTFQPLREEQLREGQLHEERFFVPPETWEAIAQTRSRGGRVLAVGTTTARALESAEGPGPGRTRLFIRPGFRFRRVDLLWTNFHLPRSSLLMLVCAFGGRERVLAAYRHAVAGGYRFYSYGDAMLVAPEESAV